MSGEDIESRSFELIDQEAAKHDFTPEQWNVVRRMIHTTADFGMADLVRFSDDAVPAGIRALESGAYIYADSNMIRSGLSLPRLRGLNSDYGPDRLLCHVADIDVVASASSNGLPRSLYAVRKAQEHLDGGIAVFGNAPVALLELNRMIIEEGLRPALVIAMPVGFVHVVESKTELMGCGVPYIAIEGRRGGSPLAVSVIHALCSVAASR
jgi:precorrin isomerase